MFFLAFPAVVSTVLETAVVVATGTIVTKVVSDLYDAVTSTDEGEDEDED